MASDILAAVSALWNIPRPGPRNLLSAPEFVALSQICEARFGGSKPGFALSNALRSLGLPCALAPKLAGLALDAEAAAAALEAAFTRTTTVRRHLCPLDLADHLPDLTFGTARVRQFSAAELEGLFDAPRLRRHYPGSPLDAARFSQFQWLVIEEEVSIDPRPEARAFPFFFSNLRADLGEIDPHLGRFPSAVEEALFFLFLAPWEDWSTLPEVDWRGFRVPWIYTLDADLAVRPSAPPSPDSLSLEPDYHPTHDGEDIEDEKPTRLVLEDAGAVELVAFGEDRWRALTAARKGPLFETPVVHFLTRAWTADGMDEVMAHLTAIEAALGLEEDHRAGLRPKPDPHKGMSATKRLSGRLAALLDDPLAPADYERLFDIRSEFVHGRAGMRPVSTKTRVLARSLARRIASALCGLAGSARGPRDIVLRELLAKGATTAPPAAADPR